MKRRNLVLSSDGARHPFRASLPPHVLRAPCHEPEMDPDRKSSDRDEIISDIKSVSLICAFGLLAAFLQPAGI